MKTDYWNCTTFCVFSVLGAGKLSFNYGQEPERLPHSFPKYHWDPQRLVWCGNGDHLPRGKIRWKVRLITHHLAPRLKWVELNIRSLIRQNVEILGQEGIKFAWYQNERLCETTKFQRNILVFTSIINAVYWENNSSAFEVFKVLEFEAFKMLEFISKSGTDLSDHNVTTRFQKELGNTLKDCNVLTGTENRGKFINLKSGTSKSERSN